MSERIANIFILAEDKEQQNLVRRYLLRCGQSDRSFRLIALPAKGPGGSGEKYVRNQYPQQVRACRSSLGQRVSALLIVVIDADMRTTADRTSQLEKELKNANMDPRDPGEPIIVLIPKRHVETWIRFLLGHQVDENTDYTQTPYSPPTSPQITQAAHKLYDLTRPNSTPAPASPASLSASIPEWRKVPS